MKCGDGFFYDQVDVSLRSLNVQLEEDCVRVGCRRDEHRTSMNGNYVELNRIIKDSGCETFGHKRPAINQVPGWNTHVKFHYAAFRECFYRWEG